MKVRIANCGQHPLTVSTSAGRSLTVEPLSLGARVSRDFIPFEFGANEIVFIRTADAKAEIRVANIDDNHDLIVHWSRMHKDGTDSSHRSLSPLGFGERVRRVFQTFELGTNETITLRQRGARDAEGIELRSPV